MSVSTPRRPMPSTRSSSGKGVGSNPGFCDESAETWIRPDPFFRRGKVLADLTIGHQAHELGDGGPSQRLRGDEPAVAQHGDGLADPVDLVEPVRDVDDGDAARVEALDEREQLIDLARRQRRRRLVHHQHRRRLTRSRGRERLGDLHHLPLGETQAIERRGRLDRHAEIGEQLARLLAQPRQSMKPNPRVGAAPRKMFSAADRCGTRLSSW